MDVEEISGNKDGFFPGFKIPFKYQQTFSKLFATVMGLSEAKKFSRVSKLHKMAKGKTPTVISQLRYNYSTLTSLPSYAFQCVQLH